MKDNHPVLRDEALGAPLFSTPHTGAGILQHLQEGSLSAGLLICLLHNLVSGTLFQDQCKYFSSLGLESSGKRAHNE